MPIKPENKKRYPANWKQISHNIIVERANNKCEYCGVNNHAVGHRDENGNFIPECGNIIMDCYGLGLDYPSLKIISYKKAKEMADHLTLNCEFGHKYIVIVLTTAHLDHIPENCANTNLLALCQKCHNNYDTKHRQQTQMSARLKGQYSFNF